MTRDEFMDHARKEIDQAFQGQKNRMMNLVSQAWAEGKKNAETDRIDELGKEIMEKFIDKIYIDPQPVPPELKSDKPYIYKELEELEKQNNKQLLNFSDIPAGCRNCPNHPSNGGSGICHCTIGTMPIMCNATADSICTAIENDKISDNGLKIMTAAGEGSEAKTYNACCDNHIHIIHDMMTGAYKEESNNE